MIHGAEKHPLLIDKQPVADDWVSMVWPQGWIINGGCLKRVLKGPLWEWNLGYLRGREMYFTAGGAKVSGT